MRASGFSLLELLFVLSLAGVVLTLSTYAFAPLSERRLTTQAMASLGKTLRFARVAAISGARTVTVCPSTAGTRCDGSGYERGWLVFSDRNGDGARDTNEPLLAAKPPLGGRLSLRTNVFSAFISFTPAGHANRSGRFVLCLDGAPRGGIVINHTGRLRMATNGELTQCFVA